MALFTPISSSLWWSLVKSSEIRKGGLRSHRRISTTHRRVITRFCDSSRVIVEWTSTHSCQRGPSWSGASYTESLFTSSRFSKFRRWCHWRRGIIFAKALGGYAGHVDPLLASMASRVPPNHHRSSKMAFWQEELGRWWRRLGGDSEFSARTLANWPSNQSRPQPWWSRPLGFRQDIRRRVSSSGGQAMFIGN